jgi:hypothetical protein
LKKRLKRWGEIPSPLIKLRIHSRHMSPGHHPAVGEARSSCCPISLDSEFWNSRRRQKEICKTLAGL